MKSINTLTQSILLGSALILAACSDEQAESTADETKITAPQIAIDSDDIGGVVASASGPEAGVWVIAETDDLDTRFHKIVVTDEQGRYVLPDLPDANYQVWLRGYGLVDSAKTPAKPGQLLNLNATSVPDEAAAAKVYPAAYWYAMMKLPEESEYEGIQGGKNGYLMWIKNNGCIGCHQLGNEYTRTIPTSIVAEHKDSATAWMRRAQSGQAGHIMMLMGAGKAKGLPFKYMGEWTDRIAAGALPTEKPDRPTGPERNVVVTVRDWSDEKSFLHDVSGTDRRDPTVNGYGKIYGSPEFSTDNFPILNPTNNTASTFLATVRDEDTPSTLDDPVVASSPVWGDEQIWDSKANSHNPRLDHNGLVWYTARIRGNDTPDFCREGSSHPSAKLFPLKTNARQISVLDPETGDYTFVDTCYGTHHLQFHWDDKHTLWTSGGKDVVGWLDSQKFLETGDAAASQGWAPLILDTNANGKQDAWVEPGEAPDPAKDMRVPANFYAVMPNPADGSIWGSNSFYYPGALVRLDPGANPPYTALGEKYNIPLPGFGMRGADIDSQGVVWSSLGSGHLGRFDRSRCKGPLNGPTATGDHCPEGWSFYDFPGPSFADEPGRSVESSYYTWVDMYDTFGLGKDVPISTANLFDGLHAMVDESFYTFRVPYPMGFYSKGFEGRIDDPDAGWKGRGLWVSSGDRTPWHMEGGTSNKPLVVHFQLRPDPLAK